MITTTDYVPFLHRPEDGTIWHYTSSAAFLEIVRSKSLWLSHHGFMNDPNEGHVGYTQFRNATWACEDESAPHIQLELSRARKRWDPLEGPPIPAFLTSFSMHGDALSQWSRYADQGRGVALGFNIASGCDRAFGALPGPLPIRVRYCRDLKEDDEPNPAVVALVRKALPPPIVHENIDAELDSAVAIVAPAFKEAGYAEESEVRLVLVTLDLPDAPDLQFRATARGIVPYVRFPIRADTLALRHIRFGPSHPQDTYFGVEELLRRLALDAEVSFSELAYRP